MERIRDKEGKIGGSYFLVERMKTKATKEISFII